VTHLAELLERLAEARPDRTAVVDTTGRAVSYGELNAQADRLAAALIAHGVLRGDRVGLVLPKCAAGVASIFGILKAGAAYVPVDVTAPAERGRRILIDCQVRAVVVDAGTLAVVPGPDQSDLRAILVEGPVTSATLDGRPLLSLAHALSADATPPPVERSAGDLAYVLYTSGSTGVPKGVMLTHENATSFVNWCSSVFDPVAEDRFSSHAPFHFDLSVLDLYVSIKHGASVFLISESLGKSPRDLARFIADNRLTVWYSTPSILTLLVQFGGLEGLSFDDLRLVLYAGEVFPVKHLRALTHLWPDPAYYNLYGPTETNVCTFARTPSPIPPEVATPYPIGFPCAHCEAVVLDDANQPVASADEGLLHIAGPSVFQGYWNRPEVNETLFLQRDKRRWYNTGDVVRWDPDRGYIYVGRRDRMVKRRGYRIELGEIERALYQHSQVREAAVVSVPDAESGVRIVAFLSCRDGAAPSIIELKTFCGSNLPSYMSPDRFVIQPQLPRTSTDKVDYQSLRHAAES
jgi:amino acid adenylation domain-containing protein